MSAPPNDATRAQMDAAMPDVSTWLAANAGSGKTRVLTDRVARLLLRGVDPQKILCLTYTKAAASEMQNRLFARLGDWAMLEDEALRAELHDLGVDDDITAEYLARARTLFAMAIETPGGLKIQTIHSFCAGLLRRFPLEAGVNPQFQEIEDRAAELLRAEVIDALIDGPERGAVLDLITEFTGQSVDTLAADVLRFQDLFQTQRSWDDIAAHFNLQDVTSVLFTGDEADLLARAIPMYLSGSSTDQKIGNGLKAIDPLDITALPPLADVFLVAGTPRRPRARLATNGTKDALGADFPRIEDFAERIAAAHDAALRERLARRTWVLDQFARRFLDAYTAAKQARGWLDFDDLILRTRALLTDPKVADWVLYRLDGGISHVLVDEAQDTSPAQWDVIRKLTQEFTSGLGVEEETARTVFVVGDKKQSIYSFQGADPSAFDEMEAEFAGKLNTIGAPFHSRSLDYSFRSSNAILNLVDASFEGQIKAGFSSTNAHKAFHADMPGRVDLWPVVPKNESADDSHWTDPIDRLSDTHHSVVLAQRIADHIAALLENGRLPDRKRPEDPWHLRKIEAGDIMILVQRRSELFHEIIRACKQRKLPIAGADRLRVGAELAVRDLLALLSFLATPDDSLSLAAALRSPLFGWSEKELFDLAHYRTQPHLWQALRAKRDAHPETFAMIDDLRGQIDFLRPYDLLERILTKHKGRKTLLARLGSEAQDGIDALLAQALAYERSAVPSLTGFLIWAQADDLEIKRQIGSSDNLIRVMTVHGAKGLEAPIVFLPDCGKRLVRINDDILADDGLPVWRPRKEAAPAMANALSDHAKDRQIEERLRLLYVALTRAEKWLIVGAAGDVDPGEDWYHRVERALQTVGAVETDMPDGAGLRYETGDWALDTAEPETPAATSDVTLEDFYFRPIDTVPDRTDPLSPSDLGGAKALPSADGLPEEIATARGTYVHTLLEQLAKLPSDEWNAEIDALEPPAGLSEELINSSRAEALSVLSDKTLRWIFASDTLAEVAIHGEINSTPVMGVIDRLRVSSDVVDIVDFKTNIAVPDTPEQTPEGILRQMGAYAAIAHQIYPGREIRIGVLWTRTAEFMSLPHSLVNDAVRRSGKLDVGQAAT